GADDERLLERPDTWQRIGRVEILGRTPCRQHLRVRMEGNGRRHRPNSRALYDDGHGTDNDGHRRGSWILTARSVINPRRDGRSIAPRRVQWAAGRRGGVERPHA